MARTEPHRQPTESTVSIGSVWAIPDLLRELGAEPAAVLKEAGLEPTLFDDRRNLVSFAARGRLLAHCARATGCQHFGLLVGQRGGLHTVGLIGLLAKYSPDVGTALRNLVGHFRVHLRGAVTSVEVEGDLAMLTYDVLQPDLEGLEQTYDGAVATMLNIMRALCGPGWKPLEARFAHRRPADVRPFRRFFGVPLTFDAERCALVFASHWLDSRVDDADAELQRLLQQQVDALLLAPDEDFTGQVRGVLRTALLCGHGSVAQVAAILGMHPRTLSRRLHALETGFQELIDEARFGIARQMLEHTAIDVSEIAASLDYSDASAFTRSFRRWSGTTPALWRAQRTNPSEKDHPLSGNVKRDADRRD